MAATKFVASSINNPQYNGEDGNRAFCKGRFTYPVAGYVGDTIDLMTVPAGYTLTEVKAVFSAAGTGVTASLGFRYKDSVQPPTGALTPAATTFASGVDIHAAGAYSNLFLPMVVDKDIIVYATIAGAAPDSGTDLYVELLGEFAGTK